VNRAFSRILMIVMLLTSAGFFAHWVLSSHSSQRPNKPPDISVKSDTGTKRTGPDFSVHVEIGRFVDDELPSIIVRLAVLAVLISGAGYARSNKTRKP